LIILSIPSSALEEQSILITGVVALVGSTGMLFRKRSAISVASASLLLLIIWGKVAGDLHGLAGPDSALLLLEFMLVIFLMDASSAALTFDVMIKRLEGKNDDISALARISVTRWVRAQLFNLGKLMTAAFVSSLGLQILGSLVSVSVNQIALTGILVLAAVLAIFILLVYRREPEERRRSID
jgi:hypothetical protein